VGDQDEQQRLPEEAGGVNAQEEGTTIGYSYELKINVFLYIASFFAF
jgi:hypothetical protein